MEDNYITNRGSSSFTQKTDVDPDFQGLPWQDQEPLEVNNG